ncbi:MAG: HD domain-containing phosphohydrolase [Anaerolineaceae bacterium]
MRLLLVSNNSLARSEYVSALTQSSLGISVEECSTLQEARKRLDGRSRALPEFLVCDVNLPDGSGLSLLKEVRQRRLPLAVILLADQGGEEAAVGALKAGADDYLIKKPETAQQLAAVVMRALEHSQQNSTQQGNPIRVLYLSENDGEVDLAQRHMELYAPAIQLVAVSDETGVLEMLSPTDGGAGFDLILYDLVPEDANPLRFINRWHDELNSEPALVVITGQGSEEIAVEALQMRVSDYVVKHPGYLFRLPSVLENVHHLKELEKEKTALRLSEERFRRLAENADDLIFRLRVEPDFAFEYINPAVKQIVGEEPEALYRDFKRIYRHVTFTAGDLAGFIERLFQGEISNPVLELITSNGDHRWLDIRSRLIMEEPLGTTLLEGIARDITEHLHQDARIENSVRKLNGLHLIDSAINSSFDLKRNLRLFLEQSVSLLEVDAADIILFEPNLSKPRLFITAGFGLRDEFPAGKIEDFHLVDESILERRTIHASVEQVRYQAPALFEAMKREDLSEMWAAPLVIKGQLKGILEVFQKHENERDGEWSTFLSMLAQQGSIALENSRSFERLQRSNRDLVRAYDETLAGWINLLELRDKETEGHTLRVLDIMIDAAEMYGFHGEEMANLRRGVILHDIGKVAIPDRILNKPGPLSEQEWVIMRQHPQLAYEMLTRIDYLRPAVEIPYCHHERWDGGGYPQGLKGTQIPLSARIFAVIDTFDALISHRAYRRPMSLEDALKTIRSQSGAQFDPEVVEKCLPLLQNYAQGIR